MNHTRILSAAGCALSALLLAGPTQGQTVILNQLPSQTFSLYDHQGIESVADQFVLTSGETIVDFTIWGTWTSGVPNLDTFDVYFHDNDTSSPFGDNPGVVLASALGVSPVVTATGTTMPTAVGLLSEYQLDFVLPMGIPMPAGTIWLEIFSTGSSGSGDTFIWEMAPQDMVNGAPCISWSNSTPGVTWNACTPLPETDMALVIRAGSPYTPYCFGDGSGTSCPCGNDNDGSVPEAGCANGQYASGAQLTGTGAASLSSDTLVLHGAYTENNQFGLYFQADNDLSPGTVWGDGLRCAGGALKRLGTRISDGSGYSDTSGLAYTISSKAGNIAPGDTKYYQLWYRNPLNSPCASDFNTSNGLAVVWQP